MKRKLTAIALSIGVFTMLAGPAVAGHLAEGVKSYTGCLVSKDGVIIKIKEGEAPSAPCANNMVQVHFSGGDITSIAVTGALTGGGTDGAVTIGLKPEFTLPTGCDAGEIAEWNGTAWACGNDADTTYTAGTGLDLTGTAFSIEPAYRVKNTPDCQSGQFSTGFDGDGDIVCVAPPAPPAATQIKGYSTHLIGDYFELAGTETVLSLNLPAGTYLLFATVYARNIDNDSSSRIQCLLPNYNSAGIDIVQSGEESLALNSSITTSGGAVNLDCNELTADVDLVRATLQALKVDTIN
jgi:hypothetical protein